LPCFSFSPSSSDPEASSEGRNVEDKVRRGMLEDGLGIEEGMMPVVLGWQIAALASTVDVVVVVVVEVGCQEGSDRMAADRGGRKRVLRRLGEWQGDAGWT